MKNIALLSYVLFFISTVSYSQNVIEGVSPVGSLNITKAVTPPYLSVVDGSLKFQDDNGNNYLDAGERASISFKVKNSGKGSGVGLMLKATEKSGLTGLSFYPSKIPTIRSGMITTVKVDLRAALQLATGKANVVLQVIEPNGFDTDPISIQIPTQAFVPPSLAIVDHVFKTSVGNMLKPGIPITLQLAIQNKGQGLAKSVMVQMKRPSENVFAAGDEVFDLGNLAPGESKIINYDFFTNKRFTATEVPIGVVITESWKKYGSKAELKAQIGQQASNNSVVITGVNPNKPVVINEISLLADVDRNLPVTRMSNPDAMAVVIGNTNYQKTKRVDFAQNDAQIIRKYLIDVLGFKEGNIIFKQDAYKSDFEEIFGNQGNAKGLLYNMVKPNRSDVFVFYSGHGAPGINNKKGYFVPVNSNPQTVELSGYSAEVFYRNLGQIPARNVTVVLDACFSGADLLEGVSPIVINSKGVNAIQNGVLMASSSDDQVSTWYTEKKHGLFTYFFLKAIHNKNADYNRDNKLTFDEIHKFVSDRSEGVPYYARRFRSVDQIPSLSGEGTERVLVEY